MPSTESRSSIFANRGMQLFSVVKAIGGGILARDFLLPLEYP
jgi:hypothetical protein